VSDDLEFTGERFVPGLAGEIVHEHWHRYAFACRFAAGRRVLDVACGEGYGSALLATVAPSVLGVDIDAATVAHARAAYADRPGLRFAAGSAAALDLPDASIDLVVSFETIEHLPEDLQPAMLAEIARVLAPGGLLLLSAPNRVEYSQARDYRNPFHLHEHDRAELAGLLARHFPAQRWFAQRRYFGSAIWSEGAGDGFEAWASGARELLPAAAPAPVYFVVLAAPAPELLPAAAPALSLCSDDGEQELRRLAAQAAELLRVDALLGERDAALDRETRRVWHMEGLVADRDRDVAERDGALAEVRSTLSSRDQAVAALTAEVARLERALTAQERIIAYRQSARWWLQLPWVRCRLWWRRMRGP